MTDISCYVEAANQVHSGAAHPCSISATGQLLVRLTTNHVVTREEGVIISTQMPNLLSFRWRSRLGLAVVLFLLYWIINVLAAVFVHLSLHINGAGGAGGALVIDPEADAMLVGRTLADLDRADLRLGAFLVSFMDTRCAYMMAFAIVHLGVTWFALRQGRAWALWVLLVGDLAKCKPG